MKSDNLFFYLSLIVIMMLTFVNVWNQKDFIDAQPEFVVFKACLDKATILNDSTICTCAEFVGHPNWCNGDIKY